jgi:hypothetical protein
VENILTISPYIAAGALLLSQSVVAQQAPELDPEVLQQMKEAGYETDPTVLQEIATGGQPMGRWKEGITFDGIEPMLWLDRQLSCIRCPPTRDTRLAICLMKSNPG